MITEVPEREKGIKAEKITGAVSRSEGTELWRSSRRARCGSWWSTTAGGVALTLDRASTAIIMDETWDPDDQEQAEDRVHRASRIHQVTVYYLRSRDTIEEYIKQVGRIRTSR
jgi:SNF2 family DNA or RNA helicase